MTKDERFLVEIYRALKAKGDFEGVVAPDELAEKLHYKEHLINNILNGLMRANFVKRYAPDEIALTPLGRQVAEELSK